MTKKRLLLLLLTVAVSFAAGYGAVAKAFPTPYWRGYFYNALDTNGLEVLPPWGGPGGCQGNGWAIPSWVDTSGEFINYIVCKLSGNSQNHIGAAFIISTMSGMKNPNPGAAEINEFAGRVNYAASQGWINFGASVGCVLPNTYYQDGPRDVAGYGGCPSGPSNSITFWNGGDYYIIKRFCANPVGNMPQLHDDLNFNISGTSSVNDTTVLPGQQITFSHTLQNAGPTSTSPQTIGWTTWAGPSAGGPWSSITGGNPGAIGAGQTIPNIGNQLVTVPSNAVPNSQICRMITWAPDTQNGGSGASVPACATVQYDFTLTPSINVAITGVSGPVAGNVAEPGDTIAFTYAVRNTGTTVSQTVTCTYRQATYTGYNQTQPVTAFTPAGANCAPTRTFPANSNTTIAVEGSVPAAAPNTSICRSLTVTPVTVAGGTRTTTPPVCVFVAAKPYTRVYGGDVSAGGGVVTSPTSSNSCVQNTSAAIIGWNRRAGGSFAGAGVQFAAYAMSTIFDTSTALGNSGGAVPPSGLAFANTSTNIANGRFGGSLGSTPCVADYYSRRPAAPPSPPTGSGAITAMTTGVYGANSNQYFSGSALIDPGERITVYVDGDVYINANVMYNGSWTSATIPSFQLIARGDIYIDRATTRLDGLYVAQPRSNGTKGTIYTCASTIPSLYTPLPLTGTLASQCSSKLTVNGAFVAKQVQLLRTVGTLRQSNAAETQASGNIAEVFNFGPALWMAQPPVPAGTADYDAISTLPPIL